jgi:radical SAM-linked protein
MRLRIVFYKSGTLRYTGHLDLQSIWERTVRRAGLPLAYSQGFHPSPKIQIASALPLGYIGLAEIVDLWLQDNVEAGFIPAQSGGEPRLYADILQPVAPPGLLIVSVEEVDDHGPALQTQMSSAEYKVTLLEEVDEADLARRVKELLVATSLPRQRRGKEYDLRPLIEMVDLLPGDGSGTIRLQMRLAAREGAAGRPDEVLDSLGILMESTRIERMRLILKDDIK